MEEAPPIEYLLLINSIFNLPIREIPTTQVVDSATTRSEPVYGQAMISLLFFPCEIIINSIKEPTDSPDILDEPDLIQCDFLLSSFVPPGVHKK